VRGGGCGRRTGYAADGEGNRVDRARGDVDDGTEVVARAGCPRSDRGIAGGAGGPGDAGQGRRDGVGYRGPGDIDRVRAGVGDLDEVGQRRAGYDRPNGGLGVRILAVGLGDGQVHERGVDVGDRRGGRGTGDDLREQVAGCV